MIAAIRIVFAGGREKEGEGEGEGVMEVARSVG
jgi:hypothetical protein